MHSLTQIHEADIDRDSSFVAGHSFGSLPQGFGCPAQPVEQADLGVVTPIRGLGRATEHGLGDGVLGLVVKTDPQRLRGAKPALGRPKRFLELGDRLVQKSHLLEGDAQVVVGLVVVALDVLIDAALELLQDLLEFALLVVALVAGRLLLPESRNPQEERVDVPGALLSIPKLESS